MNLPRWNRRATSVLVGSLLLAAHLVAPPSALAIKDGSTTDPGTFPWNNVGRFGWGSAVFLGDINEDGMFWVITAYHNQRPTDTTVQFGSTYNIVPDSFVQITNGFEDFTDYADLLMFQVSVTSNPIGLTTITLANTSPAEDDTLYLTGYGSDLTGLQPQRWASTTLTADPNYYKLDITAYDALVFETLGVQAQGGDSGGAVFRQNGSIWELAGIMLAAGPNATYSADMALYYDQIFEAIPEPGSMILLAAGVAGVLWHGKKRKAA